MNKLKRISLFLSLLLMVACSTDDITSENSLGQQIPVEVSSVQEINLEQKLEISGQVLPDTIIPLFSPTPLNVLKINKSVGDKVTKGDQIIKLDDELLSKQAEQASIAVTELEKGITAAKGLQKTAEASFQEVQQLQKELENSLEQSRQLISGLTEEDQEVDLLEIIQQSLEISLQQAELTQAAGKVSSLPQINISELEMQLEAAKENARQAKLAVDATTVTAPIDGTIAEINVTKNQTALPNSPLATIIKLNPIVATFHVNSYQVVQLQKGMSAKLVIDGLQEDIKGEISVVSPTINPQTNLFKVEIPIENLDETIKGGMRVTAIIDLGGIEKAIVVPLDSVLYDENSPYVFIAKDGVAKRQDLVLGIRNENLVEVHQGIAKDDLVITKGKERLTDGAEITVRSGD